MSEYTDARGRPRVVITGMGAMSPLGHSAEESWDSVLTGRSGIGPVTQFDASSLPSRVAGEVKDFSPGDDMSFKEARRMSRCSQLAVAAAVMALQDAGLSDKLPDPERTGVVVGTGMGGLESAFENMNVFQQKGLARVNPFSLISVLPNMPTHHVSLLCGSHGPISTVVAACATGTQSIGEGMEYIRRGTADIVIAGGVEGLIHEAAMAGFAAMRGLTTGYNDTPERASRPFDKDRDGFVLSEGAGIVVMESLEHALARKVGIYAEVLGHASSSDAHHVAVPDPEGRGAVRAMRWAMTDAHVPLKNLDYINAHGSSTPVGDAVETLSIKQLLGEYAYEVPVSSTKSVMGHAMGGTGALEAIFCIYALYHQIIPPTWNYETPDPDCDLDYVPNAPRPAHLETVMSNSFGLGGQNACLVMGRYDNDTTTASSTDTA